MDIKKLLQKQDIEQIKKLLTDSRPSFEVQREDAMKQYKVDDHDINDASIRKDKQITKDTGTFDAEGNPVTQTSTVAVARVAIPFQKLIVERRIGFMLSIPVELELKNENVAGDKGNDLVSMIDDIQDRNKMEYKNKEIARRLMSEMEVAEAWYVVENKLKEPKYDLRVSIFSPAQGDTLYPLFDGTGDMIAFGREYKTKSGDKSIEHLDVSTAEAEYRFVKGDTGWALDKEQTPNPIPNQFQKIMIVYYQQPYPEWNDVQSMIDRLETIISNHADMNDYYGSPMLKVSGEVQGYASKGEQGKIIQLTEGSEADYLALASEPSSIKMELENLQNFIYAMSQTPDITFERLQGVGNLSGVALELMFMDAHMAVHGKEEIFGIGLQRRVNILKNAIGKLIDTSFADVSEKALIVPKLTPYIPAAFSELLQNLQLSIDAGIMSKETAIKLNPYVKDPESEIDLIEGEENMGAIDLYQKAGITAPSGDDFSTKIKTK